MSRHQKIELSQLDYTRHYKKWHSDAPRHIQSMKQFYKNMLQRFLPEDKDTRILDIGCGMGFAMMALHDLGYRNLQGIDVDGGQVKSCREKGLDVTRVDDSVEFLNREHETFDFIMAFDLIEHFPHQEQLEFMRAVNSSLKNKGRIICTVPNASSMLASRWRYIDWTHCISFTEHSLDFLLYNAGFTDIAVYATEFFKKPHIDFLSRSLINKEDWKEQAHWMLFRFFRLWHRLAMLAELGWDQGKKVPLSLNLLATATKK